MGRPPMPLGSWGLIRTYPVGQDAKGKPLRFRALARFRGFDGRTRLVEASGKTATQASQALRLRLQHQSLAGGQGELTGLTKFSVASELWLEQVEGLVEEGRRSPSTVDTYRRQLKNHINPVLGEVRLGEVTPRLADRVIGQIKRRSSGATARSCRSVVSGVLALAVRHGALPSNPVREVERIEAKPRKQPRALTDQERIELLRQLRADERAVRHDLPDLVFFMLATGCRIGEALAVVWSQVNLAAGTVEITSTLIRVKGEGLLRKGTKSQAGARTLPLPASAVLVLQRRFAAGARLDQPVFPDTKGGFRDPSNVRRALRSARGGETLAWITSHTFRKTAATILDQADLSARLVADQLGHARISMTQDHYIGRRAVNSQTAEALESGLKNLLDEE